MVKVKLLMQVVCQKECFLYPEIPWTFGTRNGLNDGVPLSCSSCAALNPSRSLDQVSGFSDRMFLFQDVG
jgi:hypothetical protein